MCRFIVRSLAVVAFFMASTAIVPVNAPALKGPCVVRARGCKGAEQQPNTAKLGGWNWRLSKCTEKMSLEKGDRDWDGVDTEWAAEQFVCGNPACVRRGAAPGRAAASRVQPCEAAHGFTHRGGAGAQVAIYSTAQPMVMAVPSTSTAHAWPVAEPTAPAAVRVDAKALPEGLRPMDTGVLARLASCSDVHDCFSSNTSVQSRLGDGAQLCMGLLQRSWDPLHLLMWHASSDGVGTDAARVAALFNGYMVHLVDAQLFVFSLEERCRGLGLRPPHLVPTTGGARSLATRASHTPRTPDTPYAPSLLFTGGC